ncbi:MAG: hypothetical protein D6681_07465 [Calditrichaeota bacterium]|nr:MAG: hypothetical protein D6681_07465 [Calditrichota bacterium]
MHRHNLFWQIIKRMVATVFILYLILVVVGGGLGRKRNLPDLVYEDRPLIFAHRGVTSAAPENSLAAIRAAEEKGFPAIEVDVTRSRERHYFLFHDEEGARLLGLKGDVRQYSWQELRRRPLHHRGKPTGQYLLSLDEFFRQVKNRFVVYLDFKRNGEDRFDQIAAELDSLLRRHDLYDSVIVAEGHVPFVLYLEYRYPRIITCLQGFTPEAAYLYRILPRRLRPDYIASFYDWVDEDFLGWLHRTGMIDRYIAYGVTEENFSRVKEMGIRHYIVDYGPFLDSVLVETQVSKRLD